MSTTFAGKNVLITGGSSGIGKATARLLAAAGAHVFIMARDPDKINAAVSELKAAAVHPNQQAITGYAADVSQSEQVDDIVQRLCDAGRVPDYLFNFAGIAHPGYFQELPLSVFRETMEINFFGTLHTCRAVAPLMMARGSGHIINTSSIAGLVGVFGYTAYSASKYAIRGFSDVLRSELKPYGVRLSVLFPPDTDTPQLAQENKTKPAETRAIAGTVKVISAERVATALLAGVRRGAYLILPGFESKLSYLVINLLGAKMHWFFDHSVAECQGKNGGPRPVFTTPDTSKNE